MRTPTTRAAALLLCLAPAAMAFTAATSMTIEPNSRIWVQGSSTVRAFTCEVPQFEAAIDAQAPGAAAALLQGERAVRTATLRIDAQRMDCGNGTMNNHMARALKSAEFPTITFALDAYAPSRTATGIAGTIDGQLTLGGVTRPITLRATAKDASGNLQLQGAHDLDMTEYGLRAPSLMMGTLKVNPVVKINFDLLIKG